ncbi:MAG: ABC transporter permease [Planctomycetaceae bacterium]|jgi:lipopolysaccharide transport system permease protein
MSSLSVGDPHRLPQSGASEQGGGDSVPRVVVEAGQRAKLLDWPALWRYRELLTQLMWRDVSIRYKQTVLGAAWAVLQPLLQMAAFTLVFGRLGGLSQSVGPDYSLLVFAGLLPWQLFSNTVHGAGLSLLSHSNLITKVYFPRLIIPLSASGSPLVDFGVSSLVLVAWMLGRGVPLSAQVVLLPLFVLGTLVAAIGLGLWLAALIVEFRDFRHVLTFLLQIWMFASPVAYPLSIVPERHRLWLALNPLTGMISGFRAVLLNQPIEWGVCAISFASAAALLAIGLCWFQRLERRLADIV